MKIPMEGLLPERVSSSYERIRAGSRPRRPTVCCGPETAGSRCRGPDTHTDQLRVTAAIHLECNRRHGSVLPHLDVLGQAVEDLLSHGHCFREIPLPGLIDDVLTGVVPVEVADRLLARANVGGYGNGFFSLTIGQR